MAGREGNDRISSHTRFSLSTLTTSVITINIGV